MTSVDNAFTISELDFGLDLLRHRSLTESFVISPLSVIFALTLLEAGSNGVTRTQLDNVLAKGAPISKISHHYSSLSKRIFNTKNGVQSTIANGFFANKNFPIINHYRDFIVSNYNATVESYDFSLADQTAELINDFVKKNTGGKISDMVNGFTVRKSTSFIINAIYFHGEWETKFSINNTIEGSFHKSRKTSKKVNYMKSSNAWRLYTEDKSVRVLSLLYKDTDYALNIFLPKKRFGLKSLRNKLNGTTILKLLSELKTTKIKITIPKMKIVTNFELKDALMSLGVTKMFSSEADLSGISGSPHLYVSKAKHTAIFELDEESTTSSTSTLLGISYKSLRKHRTFTANHPFLFVVTMLSHPLFMGQFT
ncbi:serine proteinase inhibitor [Dictyocaulus viviparus]|uniref:Serine proteinase inhibitor n=1 Tax=Dictyocaulus viviparus TaxID=29172 RepID=A0A0D8Y354_DICVI|nr:serine proteinase inhibitor [Dictyocaulus viviparus]